VNARNQFAGRHEKPGIASPPFGGMPPKLNAGLGLGHTERSRRWRCWPLDSAALLGPELALGLGLEVGAEAGRDSLQKNKQQNGTHAIHGSSSSHLRSPSGWRRVEEV